MTAEPAVRSRIRTPDQRLRVFVSSTLQELAAERNAARRAIERLSAAPVMFELGARPHPPRSLYRAYLEQSDIFVGIYWERYGWIAPGETVSGLEDEYDLAPTEMPKLMYFKETKGERDPGLVRLLDRIRNDDTAAYKHFRDAKELARLLVSDLAVLLAERFDDSRSPAHRTRSESSEHPETPPSTATALPDPLTRLFGREQAIRHLGNLLAAPEVRLVTLIGPGGIGKTRLAIEAARTFADRFGDGVLFVPLAPIDGAGQVPNAIAQALGVPDTGDAPLDRKLVVSLHTRQLLLILDNFEHVVDAASLISRLLGEAPRLKLLVTSRVLLHLAPERAYEVPPLQLPDASTAAWEPGRSFTPSVELFIERARSVKPDFEVNAENVAAVEDIVARLEGVPLAIELAAARVRLLPPRALLGKLDRQLAVLVGARRDAPSRQQAVRSTIEWSTRLLSDEERALLWRVGVFAGRFSLEAVDAIGDPSIDVLTVLEGLVDASLVRQYERNGRTYLQLLTTVREYALERLEAEGLLSELEDAHAHHYADWGQRMGHHLVGPRQRETLLALSDERDNILSALRHLLAAGDWDTAAQLVYRLYVYWWIDGLLGEVGERMTMLLQTGQPMSNRSRAIAMWMSSFSGLFQPGGKSPISGLAETAELFAQVGDRTGERFALVALGVEYATTDPPDLDRATAAMEQALDGAAEGGADSWDVWARAFALVSLGRLELAQRNLPRSVELFREGLRLSEEIQDDFALTFPLYHLGWANLWDGDVPGAAGLMERQLELTLRLGHSQGVAYALESFLGVAAGLGDIETAGLLNGAAVALRERFAVFDPQDGIFRLGVVEKIRRGAGRERFDAAVEQGRRLTVDQAVAIAREVAVAAQRAQADP
ncbi:DUF4062 domain-containing protein [Lysobacter korlensis]|uniref:DUF4062 domain-containing protein n=1 Tax=Lysobacter korlensis TaxID=553636 RepID=A0ABV6RVZ1_9GAMM